MTPFTGGIDRTLRGLRTGDQRSLYLGVAMLVYSFWRRGKNNRKLLYRRELRGGEAVMVRRSKRYGVKLVVGDEIADQIR